MNAILKDNTITVEEYLHGELISEIKHEYIDGYVYAMAGAKLNHERIASNLTSALHRHLNSTPCEVVGSNFKVQVSKTKFFYPDIMVICKHQLGNDDYTATPRLIIEILSDSTQRKDRTLKRLAYQTLSSLQEYVLIEQKFIDIEVSRCSCGWDSHHYFLGDEVWLEAIDLKIPVAEIYQRVDNEDMNDLSKLIMEI